MYIVRPTPYCGFLPFTQKSKDNPYLKILYFFPKKIFADVPMKKKNLKILFYLLQEHFFVGSLKSPMH